MDFGKFLGLGMTALRSNFTHLNKPYKLNFAVTYWCQSRCATCNIWQMKPKGELDLNEIVEFAKKNNYFRWIELTGGEVFLRNDIAEIAKAFAETSKGLYVLTLPTNSLSNHDMVRRRMDEILALGIPRIVVTVSLDGYRELHDKIRGVPGNYDKAIHMFKMLQEMKKEHSNLYSVFGYTLSKFNQGKFSETFQAVKKDVPNIKYNDFHINLGQVSDNYYANSGNNILAGGPQIETEIQSFIEGREREYGMIPAVEGVFMKNLLKYVRTGTPPMHSRGLDASFFMDSFGNVYPSIMWNRKVGNVRDAGYDMAKIWHCQEAEAARKDIAGGLEPKHWTACEAYQSIVGNIRSFL